MQSVQHNFKISNELDKEIREYCKIQKIENLSEFFRRAAVKEVTPDTSDALLTFESLKDLHDKMHRLESELSVFFHLFCFYVKHFFVYNPEIPPANLQGAALSAKQRYDEMFSEFKRTFADSPSIFHSMLADYFEERD
ncbi:hypothetical protein [Treponema sp. Marseille-Q4132]|uniref:hypothetical protein n=1 Tax=Treponema sp. Marseille-Q4132 TaxID=2766701 RepID=UPI001652EAD1|nr:hypothetical protein [Treponema sp. Marseille-Q4132]QNL96632.1 hypothetical protein H9I35_09335 [Treponema sp. Marseille-Q4132]